MWRRPDSQRLAQRSWHLPRHSLDSLRLSALCHHVKMLSSASPGSRPCWTRAPSPLRSSRIPRGAFSRRWLGTNSGLCAANLHCCSANGQGFGLSSDENQPSTSMFVSFIIPFCISPAFHSPVVAHSQLQPLHLTVLGLLGSGVLASEIRSPSAHAYDAV